MPISEEPLAESCAGLASIPPPDLSITQPPPVARRYALKSSGLPSRGLVDDDALNDEQRAVALAPEGPTLVIAGAGSGKTRALTYRVARLLETGTPPERILLLTFTNRAAREMMARVESLCRVDLRKLLGGTFHHVAHQILQQHAQSLGYRDRFALLDREDSKELMSSATADLGLGVGARRFPKADVLVDLWSRAVNTQRPIAEVLAKDKPQFLILEEEILSVCRRYAERKSEMNAMDFDDLLLNWKRLLLEVPEAASCCARASPRCWSTSTRTPITCSRGSSKSSRASTRISSWSATTRRASLDFAARVSRTSSSFPSAGRAAPSTSSR